MAAIPNISKLKNVLPLFLTGRAFAVYQSLTLSEKIADREMKKASLIAFHLDQICAYEVFISRTLQNGESIDVYFADLNRLTYLIYKDASKCCVKCAFITFLPDYFKQQLRTACSMESVDFKSIVERARILTKSMNSYPVDIAGSEMTL